MAQKTVMSLLVITIVGAVLIGIYDAVRPSLASDTGVEAVTQVAVALPTATEAAVVEPITAVETPVTAPVQQSLDNVGDAWTADGVIVALDDLGMTLELPDFSTVYVELGPPSFWQGQGVALAVDETVSVTGFANGDQIHAATVLLPDGGQVDLRNETGQPLWSGGGSGNGQSEPLTQVNPEDWVTISGTISAISSSTVTLQSSDGPMTVQLGQQRFWQDQGVTLAAGDEVDILGIWQNSQFQVAEITNTQTGDRIMLRDPNGRPLWAGPGSNSQSGNGQGGNGQGGNGQGGNGQGGNRGNGQGNGYRGGRGSN